MLRENIFFTAHHCDKFKHSFLFTSKLYENRVLPLVFFIYRITCNIHRGHKSKKIQNICIFVLVYIPKLHFAIALKLVGSKIVFI